MLPPKENIHRYHKLLKYHGHPILNNQLRKLQVQTRPDAKSTIQQNHRNS